VYRRRPSKAELVLAAFIEGIRQVPIAPQTGMLRGDVLQIGDRPSISAERRIVAAICRRIFPNNSTLGRPVAEPARRRTGPECTLTSLVQHWSIPYCHCQRSPRAQE